MTDSPRWLTDQTYQARILGSIGAGAVLLGVLGGVASATPKGFRAESGAATAAAKAVGGGTALCLGGAMVIVTTIKWATGTTSIEEFGALARSSLYRPKKRGPSAESVPPVRLDRVSDVFSRTWWQSVSEYGAAVDAYTHTSTILKKNDESK